MANKKRRNKKIRRQQVAAIASRQSQAMTGAGTAAEDAEDAGATANPVSTASASAASATAKAPQKAPAYASKVSGPRSKAQASQSTTIDIESRVPYFAKDLRRIAITAGLLVAGIVGASFFIR